MSQSKPARNGRLGTLGPVADLESHLPPDWWNELFDSIYLKTDGDLFESRSFTVQEVDFLIKESGVGTEDRILDVCCGQGRHLIELARRGYTALSGVDRSRYLIRLARRRADSAGLDIAFHEGDARRLRLPEGAFDYAFLLGNSYGFFDDEADDGRVLESIQRVMAPGGTLVLDLADGDWLRSHYEPRSWEWIDQNHFVCRERSLSADGKRLISREVVTHAERGVIADQFYAERLYSVEQITALLNAAGYRNLRHHASIDTKAEKGHDLGMMAHRLFLTAVAPAKRPRVAKPRQRRDVDVVLGDPRLPDAVKLNGQFNAEDLDTVRRLKEALESIGGYSFTYYDDHGTMARDVARSQGDFVFNLCDEGYHNDAFRELHVPALLEMSDRRYTGAGPACLGLCYDKSLVRSVADALGIAVPLETYVRADDQGATLPSVFPAILKPNFGDSSIGITKDAVVEGPEQLVSYLAEMRDILPNRPILVQEFLPGAEYSVGLIGNPETGWIDLPLLEVDYGKLDPELPRILGYESKWEPESPYWTDIRYRPASLRNGETQRLIEASKQLFERLRCRDYARFDFRTGADGTIRLLEVNPNPGWCWDGKLNLMAGFGGHSYADLLRMILEAAQRRFEVGIVADAPAVPSVQPVAEERRASA